MTFYFFESGEWGEVSLMTEKKEANGILSDGRKFS